MMRTREEQIAQLNHFVASICPDMRPSAKQALNAVAKDYVEEAEERAREECAADTRRLEWLLSRTHYGIPGFDPKVSGRSPSERKEALIRAIDAAMEGGNG